MSTKTKEQLRQVLMRRPTDAGHVDEVYWIRCDLAKSGRRVRDSDGTVWSIMEIYNTKTVADLEELYSAWKRWEDVLSSH